MPTNQTGGILCEVCDECNESSAPICLALQQCVNRGSNDRFVVKPYGFMDGYWVIEDRTYNPPELYRYGRKRHHMPVWRTKNEREALEHCALLNKHKKKSHGELSTSMYIHGLRQRARARASRAPVVVTGFTKCERCGKRVKGVCPCSLA